MWLCSLLDQMPAKENPNLGRLELPLLFFASLISPPSEKPFNQKIACECQDEKSCAHDAVIRVYDAAGRQSDDAGDVIATLEKPVGIELPQFSLLRSTRLIIGGAHLRTMTNPPGHPRLCYAGALCNQAAPRIYEGSDPNGIRTRVTAVKGRCPGPLDDRVAKAGQYRIEFTTRKANWQRDLACIVPEAGGTPASTAPQAAHLPLQIILNQDRQRAVLSGQ